MTPLLKPFQYSLRNRFIPGGRPPIRTVAIILFGAALFMALYLVSIKVVGYFHSQSDLGIILSLKIFQMAWMIIFFMLIFSSMVSGVSSLFLSNDNEIFFASPAPPNQLFFMRYITTTVYTSWMLVIFSLPVFSAYGVIFACGWLYWPLLVLAILATTMTASATGLACTIALVNLFPARRTKDIILYLSLLFGILLYLAIRLMRPEDLADPERFPDFIEYLSSISTPASPVLPPAWAANILTTYLQDRQADWLLLSVLLLTPFVCYFIGEWAMTKWFFPGFSKAQESFGGSHIFRKSRYRPANLLWFFRKELRVFLRDSAEWSQLFLVGALIVVYLYNFKVLPLDRSPMPTEYIANLIAYANIGLTGFMVASLSARFVFPCISTEGSGFGIIQTSPLSVGRYMLYKYLFYVIPFTLLALILLLATNHMLHITGPMQWLSLATGMIITWSIVAMALGFGAMYADFKAENRATMLGSFGAIFFLFSALSFELIIITLGTMPAYRMVRTWLRAGAVMPSDLFLTGLSLITMILGALAVSIWCFYKGVKKLEQDI